MSPSNHKHLAECESKELYCVWKGQLLVQEQQLCDIVLRSPFCGSIPAQLPAKLDIRHAVCISELRKKLPEAAFRRSTYIDCEVSYQDILYHLYEVEILNKNGPKVEQLLECLKERDLALVRYLNGQGVLILLASTALVKEKDSGPDERTHFQALFLIPSTGPECLKVAKDVRCQHGEDERSVQVTLALPSLHYALSEGARNQGEGRPPPDALVKQHMQEFAKLSKNLHPGLDNSGSLPLSFDLPVKKPDLGALPEKCPQSSYHLLQFYLSHPQNYTLEMSAAAASLNPSSPSAASSSTPVAVNSSSLKLDPVPPKMPTNAIGASLDSGSPVQSKPCDKDAPVKTTQAGDRPLQWCKRRSSRLLGASTRKKWSPNKVLCMMENSKKRKKNAKKKKKSLFPSFQARSAPSSYQRNSEPKAEFSEPTLKLKILQNPLKRKRGAQVLSAEFVQDTREMAAPKATSFSDGLDVSGKKPRLLRCKKDGGKLESQEQMDIRRPVTRRSACHSITETTPENLMETGDENRPEGVTTATQDICSTQKREECDSHALNMLADLALSSCNSLLISNGSRTPPVYVSPSRDRRCSQKGSLLCKSPDYMYHRDTRNGKGGAPSGKRCQRSLLSPRQSSLTPDLPSSSRDLRPRKKGSMKPDPVMSHMVPPKESGDLSNSSMQSLICSEHSYASLSSESPKKGTATPVDPRNGVKHMKAGSLVLPSKVLPFRHQQHLCQPRKRLKNCVPFMRPAIMARRLKEDFFKSHKVTFCDRTVKVAFQWEAEYLFSLDSKYTSHPLEKTVVRAVHGPWDANLPDDMEEMKLILHTWVALFYSKPFKSPTVRNVVEHSNPAKYVSLNSLVDPFEFPDDYEGSCSLEKCPADSPLEAAQTLSEGEERLFPSIEMKPLSCNKLSSTNSIDEDEPPPPANGDGTGDWPLQEDPSPAAACNPKDLSPPFTMEAEKKTEKESLLDPLVSTESLNRNSSCEQSDAHASPQTFRVDVDSEADRGVNIIEVSQSDALPITADLPENSAGDEAVANNEAATLVKSQETNSASPSTEEEKSSPQPGVAELLPASEAEWVEAGPVPRVSDSPCRDVGESQDFPTEEEDANEESAEWESIDLALSESNDTDAEPQDEDLDQEETDMRGERGTVTPSPNSSLFTSSASQPEPSDTQEVSELSASESASPSPVDLVEGSCFSQEDSVITMVGSVSLQASPLREDEETESTKSEDAAKHSVIQKQRDVDKILLISEEDKAIALTESPHEQASELSQVQRDAAGPEELVKSQDSFESVRNPPSPNPVDLADIPCASREEKDNSLTDSCERQASLVHHAFAAEDTDFPRDQEAASERTEHRISPLQMGLIEDISQDGNEQEGAGEAVQNCKERQVQSSMLAQGKSAGNQEVPVVSAQSLVPSKEMDLILGSSVLQEEEGISLANATQLPGGPVCQTSSEITVLPRNQEESVVTIQNVELLEQVDLAQDSCLHQEKETISLPDTASLPNNDPLQVHDSTITQEEQDSRQTEGMNGSLAVKENHCLEEDNKEFESDSETGKCCVEDKNVRDSSVSQDVEPDGRKSQISGTVSEGSGPLCGTLVDPVSATAVESEKACAKDNSNMPWINSVNLENVTPESDEESPVNDQFAHTGEKCVGNGHLQEGSMTEDLRRTTSESQGQRNSAWQENTKCHQVEIVEAKTPRENDAASTRMDIIPSSLCPFWPGTGTSSLEYGLPLVKAAVPSKDDEPLDESTASKLCDVDVGQINQDISMPEEEEHFKGASAEVTPCLPTEYSSEPSSGEYDSLPLEDARENLEESEEALSSERTHSLTRVAGVNLKWDGESTCTFEGGDHEVAGDSDHRISESSCIAPSAAAPGDVKLATVCDLSLNQEISRSGDWICLEDKEKMLDVEAETLKHDGPFASKGDGRLVMPSLENSNKPGLLKEYINFSVTMKHREKNRTFHSSKQHDCLTRALGSGHSWSKTWGMWNDPTENTLAMECLRFHFKVNQVLRKSQLSTSAATFTNEFSSQVMADVLPLSNVPEGLALSSPPRSQSPLQITVRNPSQRHSSSYQYPRSSRYRNYFEPPPPPSPPLPFVSTHKPLSKAARCKNQGPGPVPPFHLNKLTYNNKLKDFRGDISVIMDEFAELSTVMALDDRQTSNKGRGQLTTSEDASEKSRLFLTQRTVAYEHLFADLCNTLHCKLKNVAQEACKKPYSFYLLETDDDPFFGRLKNLLKKGGHSETDPLHFCKTSHVETDRLLVIIRNEDILSHVHKIPCLLRLKRFPCVTFAGVDSPEDILDHTYQELFHRGGFVVSDDKILEAMTLGELKKMVQTLDNLQGHGRWRWLFHYKEMKQLREKARMDSAAHTKESLLKSCQGANVTEVLHYHQCDSRSSSSSSSSRAELLNCLLNLQVQHISERFAVFLTEKPNPSREAFEHKGLLVLDVNTFLATAEDMAALFRSSSG